MKFRAPGKNWVFKVGQRVTVDMGSFGMGCTIAEIKDKGAKFVVEWFDLKGKRRTEEIDRCRLMV